MGAWSAEPFGNDVAGDWAWTLTDSKGSAVIESALDAVLNAKGVVDADAGCEAIAAVEVVAKLLGRGTQSDSYTEEVDEWVAEASWVPSGELCSKALLVLGRVSSSDSELRELWEEGGDDEFIQTVGALRAAVQIQD